MPIVLAYIIIYFLIFMMGACIGSFYNVIALRVPIKESFVKGRSHCPSCKHTLNALDLVPFFSYIFLRGKCRYCKEKISIRYPIVELVGGLSAIFCYWKFGLSLEALLAFYIISVLVPLAIIDFETKEIPNGFHFALMVAVVGSFFLQHDIPITSRIIGVFAMSVPMALITIFFNGFGGGDIRLMAVAGALLGWKGILCAFMIGIFSSIFEVLFLLVKKNAGMKTEFAFGPYLAFGIVISYLYSNSLISFYLGMFF